MADGSSDWELVKDKAGISIYTRDFAGSTIREVHGKTRVQASLSSLVTLLREPELRQLWDDHCAESTLQRRLSETEELVYLHTALPWPVQDRDMVMQTQWAQDPESLQVSVVSRATSGQLAENPGKVRVKVASHDWLLTPLDERWVLVETTLHLDPEGPIPTWLINRLSIDGPYKTLDSIRDILATDKVQARNYDFLRDVPQGFEKKETRRFSLTGRAIREPE